MRFTFGIGALATVAMAATTAGCPSARNDAGDHAGEQPSPQAPSTSNDPSGRGRDDGLTPVREETIVAVPLAPATSLTADPIALDPPGWGLDLDFDVTTLDAPVAARSPSLLHATLAQGRLRLVAEGHPLALDDRFELRGTRARLGFLALLPRDRDPTTTSLYRVVPPGALRSLILDRRIDVLPLAPTQVSAPVDVSRRGQTVSRVTVRTSYATLVLDQETAPKPASPPHRRVEGPADAGIARASDAGIVATTASASADAASRSRSVEGAGEPLCRFFLELVASDRALAGAPCSADRVPVHAEISFAAGGGVRFEARDPRELDGAPVDVAFPPANSRLFVGNAAIGAPSLLLDPPAMLALHPHGDPVGLTLVDRCPIGRVVTLDDAPVAWLPAGSEREITVRQGRYRVGWRSALGEIVEPSIEVDAPGRATSIAQFSAPSSSPSSIAPIASARIGP